MKQDPLHVKQDEWAYPCTQSNARRKVKRARTKAKRQLAKKLLGQDLQGE